MSTLADLLGFDPNGAGVRRAQANSQADLEFIAALHARRIDLGLSHDDVAKRLGWSERDVRVFEASDSDPTLSQIRRVAQALEVTYRHEVESAG